MSNKTSYIDLINQILGLIVQSPLLSGDISTVTVGNARIVADKINFAQKAIYTKANWYSLFKERLFRTSQNGFFSVIDFSLASGVIVSLVYNGTLVTFTGGVDFTVETSNEKTAANLVAVMQLDPLIGPATIITRSLGEITVRKKEAEDNLGITSPTSSIVEGITAELKPNGLYSLDENFGRSISLADSTQNIILTEIEPRFISMNDANDTESGSPDYFATFGNFYRLYPSPGEGRRMIDRFYSVPAPLINNSDIYDLPMEIEPSLLKMVEAEMNFYLNKSIKGNILMKEYKDLIEDAKEMNEVILDRLHIFGDDDFPRAHHPQLPSNFFHGER